MSTTVGIVGAGMGGLVAACRLAGAGYEVTVFDKAATPGGSAGWYVRQGRTFPTGATIAFGLEPGGLLRRLLDELAIDVPARLLEEPMAVVLPDRMITIYHDPARWEEELRRKLPEADPSALVRFWRELSQLAQHVAALTGTGVALPIRRPVDLGRLPAFAARHPLQLLRLGRSALRTVHDLLAKHGLDQIRPLRQLLDAQLLDAVQIDATQAALLPASLALDAYRMGSYAIEGGFATLATALQLRVSALGGQVRLATEAHDARFDRSIRKWELTLRRGDPYACDVLVLATGQPLGDAVPAVPPDAAPWGAVRLDALLRADPTWNAEAFPQLPFAYQIMPDTEWEPSLALHGPLYVTLHRALDARRQPVEDEWMLTASVHTKAEAWTALTADEARQRKVELRETLYQSIGTVLPRVQSQLLRDDLGTPRTYERFLGKPAVGGYPLTVANAILHPVGCRGRLPGLYVAGENGFPGPGTLSAALSGWYASRAIIEEHPLMRRK